MSEPRASRRVPPRPAQSRPTTTLTAHFISVQPFLSRLDGKRVLLVPHANRTCATVIASRWAILRFRLRRVFG